MVSSYITSSPNKLNAASSPATSVKSDIKNESFHSFSELSPDFGSIGAGDGQSIASDSGYDIALKRSRSRDAESPAKRVKSQDVREATMEGALAQVDYVNNHPTPTTKSSESPSSSTEVRNLLIIQHELTSPPARAEPIRDLPWDVVAPIDDVVAPMTITEQNRRAAIAIVSLPFFRLLLSPFDLSHLTRSTSQREKKDAERAQAARDAERAKKDKFGTDGLRAYGLFNNNPHMKRLPTSPSRLESSGVVRDAKNYVVNENCSEEQRKVLDAVRSGRNVFFTGSAGE
jgi:hypothetical protein